MSYQPKVYHKQGGDELVVASGGQQTVESGGVIVVQSGGTFTLDSGAVFSNTGAETVASGGSKTFSSGASATFAAGATLQVNGALAMGTAATLVLPFVAEAEGSTMSAYGISSIGGTTAHTWPIAPPVAGAVKMIAVNAASTDAAQTIYSGSSGITFDGTNDTLVIESPAGFTLVGLSATRWHQVGRQLAIASSSEIAGSIAST